VIGSLGTKGNEWTATLGDVTALRLQETGGWRGRLAVGGAAARAQAPLPAQGIALAVTLPMLDIDAWRGYLGNGGASGTDAFSLFTIDIRGATVHALKRRYHDVRLNGTRGGTGWRLAVDSREAQGQLTWDGAGAGRIAGRLARFHLPAADAAPADDAPDTTRALPAVDLVIDRFQLGDLALGEVSVKAENREGAWRAKVSVKNDAAALTGEGSWQPGGAARRTALAFKLDIEDGEKLLGRLGMPDAMRSGRGRIEGDLAWSGAPFALDLPSLSGRMSIDFGKGQFKQLEPGVGRLLGVLSLQSLPRRVTLDFRDIFSQGFAFDVIAGEAALKQGTMTTKNLQIRGPAARVLLSGTANLVAETQDLKVRIQPAVGETLAVGTMLLANPVTGVVAWAAQKILNDPLDHIFAYEYAVTGGWSDPQVAKISNAVPSPEVKPQ
jgi:uncharacterized protein YhdP